MLITDVMRNETYYSLDHYDESKKPFQFTVSKGFDDVIVTEHATLEDALSHIKNEHDEALYKRFVDCLIGKA